MERGKGKGKDSRIKNVHFSRRQYQDPYLSHPRRGVVGGQLDGNVQIERISV